MQLRQEGVDFWLDCPDLGAVRFNLISQEICAYPQARLEAGEFEQILIHEWLPLVYPAWGYQTLHASAAAHLESRRVAAFAGPMRAGKSTLGYALGQRPGWIQVADESLALRVEAGRVQLVHIPNFVRLRPASAARYGWQPEETGRLQWPGDDLHLADVFFLEFWSKEEGSAAVRLKPLNGVQAYPLFLQQAFALTLKLPQLNRRLLGDYLKITLETPALRLAYRKSFEALDEVLDAVESCVLA